MGAQGKPAEKVALDFARALARRDYAAAHALTAGALRARSSEDDLRQGFEAIVPGDWGDVDPIEVGHAMDDWPAKRTGDVRWVYVSLGGDVYSEGLSVIVAADGGDLLIRDVEWGRP